MKFLWLLLITLAVASAARADAKKKPTPNVNINNNNNKFEGDFEFIDEVRKEKLFFQQSMGKLFFLIFLLFSQLIVMAINSTIFDFFLYQDE